MFEVVGVQGHVMTFDLAVSECWSATATFETNFYVQCSLFRVLYSVLLLCVSGHLCLSSLFTVSCVV